jgi:hypothetical protein
LLRSWKKNRPWRRCKQEAERGTLGRSGSDLPTAPEIFHDHVTNGTLRPGVPRSGSETSLAAFAIIAYLDTVEEIAVRKGG